MAHLLELSTTASHELDHIVIIVVIIVVVALFIVIVVIIETVHVVFPVLAIAVAPVIDYPDIVVLPLASILLVGLNVLPGVTVLPFVVPSHAFLPPAVAL